MPTGCQFRDQEGYSVSLYQIDKEICFAYGEEPDEKYFSPMLQIFLQIAITLVSNNGGGIMTETLLEDFLKRNPETDPKNREILKNFFVKDYIFTAWPEDK